MKEEKIVLNPGVKPATASAKVVTPTKVENIEKTALAEKTAAPAKTVAPEKAVTAAPVKEKTIKAKPVKEAKAAKKTAVKKAPVKKEPVKAVSVKESLCIELADRSYSKDDLVKIAKDVWKYDLKEKANDMKSIELYVKPEENKVYYVFNGNISGNFDI